MKLIKEMLEIANDTIMTNGFDRILENLKELRALAHLKLEEGFMDNHRGDLDRKFDELEAKIIDARRTLGKLNSDQNMDAGIKAMYKSNLMKNLNKFRYELELVMKELGMSDREKEYHRARIGLDREYGKPSEVFTKKQNEPEQEALRDRINKQRNFATPEKSIEYKHANKPTRWYQKIFR